MLPIGNLWCWSQKQTSEKKCQPYWSIILCFYMKINILSCSASDLKCPSNLVKKKKRKASRKSIFPKKHVKERFQSIGRNSTIPIPQTSVGATCQKYCASCWKCPSVITVGLKLLDICINILQFHKITVVIYSQLFFQGYLYNRNTSETIVLWLYSPLKYTGLSRNCQHKSGSLNQTFKKDAQ